MKQLRSIGAIVLLAGGILAGDANAADSLVTTDWLERNLNNPQVRAIEVSVNPGVFERGHIPGSVNIVWHTDLVDRVRRDLVSKEDFQALLRQAGVNSDTTGGRRSPPCHQDGDTRVRHHHSQGRGRCLARTPRRRRRRGGEKVRQEADRHPIGR
jgi:hypothetical protein